MMGLKEHRYCRRRYRKVYRAVLIVDPEAVKKAKVKIESRGIGGRVKLIDFSVKKKGGEKYIWYGAGCCRSAAKGWAWAEYLRRYYPGLWKYLFPPG